MGERSLMQSASESIRLVGESEAKSSWGASSLKRGKSGLRKTTQLAAQVFRGEKLMSLTQDGVGGEASLRAPS